MVRQLSFREHQIRIDQQLNRMRYVEWYTETPSQTLLDEVKKRGPLLTYMMPFSYDVKRDGTLTPLNWGGLDEDCDKMKISLRQLSLQTLKMVHLVTH